MPGTPRFDGKTFLVFTYIWQEDVAKIPKLPVTARNANTALAITWLVGATFYCTIFNNNSPPPRQFLLNVILLKKTQHNSFEEKN